MLMVEMVRGGISRTFRGICVNGGETRVRMGRPHERSVRHIGGRKIRTVCATTANKAEVFLAQDRRADAARFHHSAAHFFLQLPSRRTARQRFLNTAGRFSANAAMPSFWSSRANME